MRARTLLLSALSLLASAACSGTGPATSSGLSVVRDTVGDTVVVRTVSGSVWGAPATLVSDVSIGKLEGDPHYLFGRVSSVAASPSGAIYALDSQSSDVRVFDPSGAWVRTLGRNGEGPGELKQPDAIAILSDGRVLVRDPGNQRIQVYGADGATLKEWPYHTGFYTSDPLWTDRRDNTYIEVLMNQAHDPSDWKMGLVRYRPDGTIQDTVPVPRSGFKTPQVTAHSADGGASVAYGLPFGPGEYWALSPDGYFLRGVSTDYRIDLLRADAAPLRIERSYEPVAVQAGEKDARRRAVVRGIRLTVPDWKWSGPAIPDQKPPFSALMVGHEGRIWVTVPQPAREVPNPDYDPKKPDSQATRWKEPVAFDVFQTDGTYLGRVNAPSGLATYPRPFLRNDTVWAVTRDSLDVERVVRYHVQHGGKASP